MCSVTYAGNNFGLGWGGGAEQIALGSAPVAVTRTRRARHLLRAHKSVSATEGGGHRKKKMIDFKTSGA